MSSNESAEDTITADAPIFTTTSPEYIYKYNAPITDIRQQTVLRDVTDSWDAPQVTSIMTTESRCHDHLAAFRAFTNDASGFAENYWSHSEASSARHG